MSDEQLGGTVQWHVCLNCCSIGGRASAEECEAMGARLIEATLQWLCSFDGEPVSECRLCGIRLVGPTQMSGEGGNVPFDGRTPQSHPEDYGWAAPYGLDRIWRWVKSR